MTLYRQVSQEKQSNNNKMSHPHKLLALAVQCTVVGSTALAIMGCQSTPLVTSTSQTTPIIDFSIADAQSNRTQSHLFNASIDQNIAHYDRLFNQQLNPNSDNKAKQKLVQAIRQHLNTEQVAVAQASYHLSPFIKPDSIDSGSNSLLQTALEVYGYQQDDEGSYDESDSGYDYDDDYDYDYDYELEEYNNYSADSEVDSTLDSITRVNSASILEAYEAIQLAKQYNTQSDANIDSQSDSDVISFMLQLLQKTPEQLEAQNAYQMRYLTLNSISQYQPDQRQYKSVYSYDYVAPTVSASLQLPLSLDFDSSRLTVDPSALMPVMALFNPENTPLPDELITHTIDIGLPKMITSQLPSDVIYDATISAVQDSIAELDPELFSLIDIAEDDFAKQVGAAQGVKVYFGSKQTGEMLGKIFKHISQTLEQHIDDNPDRYPDGVVLKSAISKAQLYNKGYHSDDIGSLLQLIEVIMPISFNQVNYYYLDKAGQLVGKQQRINMGSGIAGMTLITLNQIRYDQQSFQSHALKPLLEQSFGHNAPAPVNGNELLQAKKEQSMKFDAARQARYDYVDYNHSESDDLESYFNNDFSLE